MMSLADLKTGTVFIFCCMLYVVPGFSQDSVFARQMIQTLSSKEMYGRSASHQGEWKAAEVVAKTMQENHLSAFNNNYFQSVAYANKAYNGAITLQIDGVSLIPFEDFVIAPESKCAAICAAGVVLQDTNFSTLQYKKKYRNKFIIIDLSKETQLPASTEKIRTAAIQWALRHQALGLIFLTNNFRPYRVSEFQHYKDLVVVEIKKSVFSTAIQSAVPVLCLSGTTTFLPDYRTRNVIAYTEGTSAKDSFIVITAHYDHLGSMGDNTVFHGANDNAASVALMLDLAKTIQKNPARYTLVYIACCGEEMGLLGSKFFVENPLIDLSRIKIVLNFDLLCAGEEGIAVINGLNLPREMDWLTTINNENNYLPTVTPAENSRNSDHYWFTTQGVPAFFVLAKGKTAKGHHPDDRCENCTLSGYNAIFKLFYQFIQTLD